MNRKNHSMVYERGSSRRKQGFRKPKKSKKRSVVSRKLSGWKRKAEKMLGYVGMAAMIVLLFWLATRGGGW